MEELQLKLFEKQLTTIFFIILGQKGHFFPKNGSTIKKSYSPKYVYWYQCFNVWKMVGAKSSVHGRPAGRPNAFAIDSHCLCMRVKNGQIEFLLLTLKVTMQYLNYMTSSPQKVTIKNFNTRRLKYNFEFPLDVSEYLAVQSGIEQSTVQPSLN